MHSYTHGHEIVSCLLSKEFPRLFYWNFLDDVDFGKNFERGQMCTPRVLIRTVLVEYQKPF